MRILHIFDHSLPLQSGYVTRSLGILRSQRARGWQTVHLTAPRHAVDAGRTAAVETFDGLTFERTLARSVALPIAREANEMWALTRRLAALVRAERPDILHAHSPVLNALPALAVGRRFGLPVVYEVRALWEDAAVDLGLSRDGGARYRATRWVDTRMMKRASGIVVLCEALRDEIIARGIPPARLTVVPNAVDPHLLLAGAGGGDDRRRSLGLEGRTVLGFIGSYYAYEGLDALLEAGAMLRASVPNLAILLVGGGPEEARLRQLAAERGLGETVVFVGRVKLQEVSSYYRAIDICVFPRRRMRLTDLVTPLKPLEAMAHLKPVVASSVGGHRELVRASETGYLFAPDDAAALASCLRTVIADPEGRARIAANGRRFVETERNWDAVAGRYAPLYESLLTAKRRPIATAPEPERLQ
jgi:glycogen synthase